MTTIFKSVPLVAPGHTRPVTHLSFSPLQDAQACPSPLQNSKAYLPPLRDSKTYYLISSCKDGNPMLREWTGDWIGTFVGHKGAVWSSKISRDATRAASGSADFTAKIWDACAGACLHSFPHNHIVRTVALSPTASHLLTGGQEKKVRIFDITRPDAPPDYLEDTIGSAHEGTIKSAVWITEHLGVTAGEDGKIKWWDMRTRGIIARFSFPNAITSMELSPQTSRLVVTSGKTVAFISADPNGPPTHSLTLSYSPSSASIHPILQDRFVTGSLTDEWVRVHTVDGEEREILKGHHGPVHCVEFSPDGEQYASGSEDGTIRLWQTTPGKTYGLWQGNTQNGG